MFAAFHFELRDTCLRIHLESRDAEMLHVWCLQDFATACVRRILRIYCGKAAMFPQLEKEHVTSRKRF